MLTLTLALASHAAGILLAVAWKRRRTARYAVDYLYILAHDGDYWRIELRRSHGRSRTDWRSAS